MPKRIQRKRTKGWKMPENAVYVGRPTIWMNPFVVGKPSGVFPKGMGVKGRAETLIESMTLDQVVSMYSDLAQGFICPEMYPHGHDWMAHFKKKMNNGHPVEMIRSYLRGKDLACWCPLDCPCHADVLLELANQ